MACTCSRAHSFTACYSTIISVFPLVRISINGSESLAQGFPRVCKSSYVSREAKKIDMKLSQPKKKPEVKVASAFEELPPE